jgi:hypothetical protein
MSKFKIGDAVQLISKNDDQKIGVVVKVKDKSMCYRYLVRYEDGKEYLCMEQCLKRIA